MKYKEFSCFINGYILDLRLYNHRKRQLFICNNKICFIEEELYSIKAINTEEEYVSKSFQSNTREKKLLYLIEEKDKLYNYKDLLEMNIAFVDEMLKVPILTGKEIKVLQRTIDRKYNESNTIVADSLYFSESGYRKELRRIVLKIIKYYFEKGGLIG